jgi:hypothetical protein
MSETLSLLKSLVARRQIRVSVHGLRELAADNILLDEVAAGIDEAVVIEDYRAAFKGPSVLVLQRDGGGQPIHIYGAWRRPGRRPQFWSPPTDPILRDGRLTF